MRRRAEASRTTPLSPLGGAAAGLYVAFVGLPLLALVFAAVAQDGFLDSLTAPLVLRAVRLSVVTTIISVLVIVFAGTPFAYLLARRDSRLLRVVDALVELPIVLPPVVAGVALLMTFGRNGLLGPLLQGIGVTLPFTTAAVVLAQVFVAAPFYVRAAKIGFQGVDVSYEDMSQTLGASPWRTFWGLTLPMAWPSLAGGVALSWARAFSEFGATIMFAGNFMGRTQTVPLAILSAMETDIGAALAVAVLALVASAVVLFLLGIASRRGSRELPDAGWRRG